MVRNKRALNELLHKCGIWKEYTRLVLQPSASPANFDAVLRGKLSEEMERRGRLAAEEAKSMCYHPNLALPARHKSDHLPFIQRRYQEKIDEMLMCINFWSRLENGSWAALLDKYKSYSRKGLHYCKELMTSYLLSSLQAAVRSG